MYESKEFNDVGFNSSASSGAISAISKSK